MTDRLPSALTRAGPNVRNTVNNNKLMAGYYGRQQALQQINQQQNPNTRTASSQQYQKHQQFQNRKSGSTFNENNMDAILTCKSLKINRTET